MDAIINKIVGIYICMYTYVKIIFYSIILEFAKSNETERKHLLNEKFCEEPVANVNGYSDPNKS